MLSFFVPSIENDDDPALVKRNWETRVNRWKNIISKQFQLNYFGKINYADIGKLTVHERESLYGLLVEQKTDERTQYDKAIDSAKAKRKNKGS